MPLVYEPQCYRSSGSYRNDISKLWGCNVPDTALLEIGSAVVRDGPHDISTISRRVASCNQKLRNGCRKNGSACQSCGFAGFDRVTLQQRDNSFFAVVLNWKEVLPTSGFVKVVSTPSYLRLMARDAQGLHETRLFELLFLHHAAWQIGSCRSLSVPVRVVESQRRGPAGATCTWLLTSGQLQLLAIYFHNTCGMPSH